MGASASKHLDKCKGELTRNVDLACCRVQLLRKRMENELATTYQAINSNSDDVQIKGEQSIYQEATLQAIDHLIKDLNLLKTRKHLLGPQVDEQLKPCLATIIHCADRLDVPELRVIVKALRQLYGKDFTAAPDEVLLQKLSPRPPTPQEVQQQIERVTRLVRSNTRPKAAPAKGLAPTEKVHPPTAKHIVAQHTELDDLLERMRRLRS